MTQDNADDLTPDRNAGSDGPQSPAEAAAAELVDRLNKSEAELAETKDKLLRALAETENLRRRAQREREDASKYAAANFAKDMLDVADNFRRALASIDPASLQDERAKALIEGVAATERALLAAFERHGIKRIEPEIGERFDPNLHEAMFEVPGTGKPGGSIVQVVQTGYRMHDRLLRPAMVGVAKASAPSSGSTVDQTV
ncbi:MAG TPA: nucleotide exchange factor GrpE [Stellaceae bacterium]|jgi:molecular chaperone GrpE|nr:nucleotide exchange factor GrpE [Stellaceae bacterium]